jgi:hypothetical protein
MADLRDVGSPLPMAEVPICTRGHVYGDDRSQCEDCQDRREAVAQRQALRSGPPTERGGTSLRGRRGLPDELPTIGSFDDLDGQALFYRGQHNDLHGRGGTMKSLIALVVALQNARRMLQRWTVRTSGTG